MNRRYNAIDPQKKKFYRELYLRGITIKQIAYLASEREPQGVVIGSRTIYHHLQPLSPQDKAQHVRVAAAVHDRLFHSSKKVDRFMDNRGVFILFCFAIYVGFWLMTYFFK